MKNQRELELPTYLLCRKQWKVQRGSLSQADHMEDSAREKLTGLKFTVNESLETMQKLDKTIILENTRPNLQ